MAKQYSATALKKIGEQCGHKLPPASAVQAMFLYEMQRESELERLFQGHIFRIARLDDNSKTLQVRLSELCGDVEKLRSNTDARLSALRKEITTKEVEERIATSQVRMNTLGQKLTQCNERIDAEAAKVALAQGKINAFSDSFSAQQGDMGNKLTSLDEDVAVLFEERDAMFEMHKTATALIESLDKDVKKLLERTSTPVSVYQVNATMHEYMDRTAIYNREQHGRIEKLEIDHKEQNECLKELVKEKFELVQQQTRQKKRIEQLESERNEQIEQIEKFKADQKECVIWLAKEQLERIKRHKYEQNDRIERLEKERSEQNERFARLEKERNEQNDRIDKLEDLIRVLTAQSPVTSSPASQILAVHTTNGQSLDLAVPKGRSYVPYKKENIRSFTPGLQWMA